ncbi:hypothetical protein BpHYR1_005075, partial [Brachionus plicatilis]
MNHALNIALAKTFLIKNAWSISIITGNKDSTRCVALCCIGIMYLKNINHHLDDECINQFKQKKMICEHCSCNQEDLFLFNLPCGYL